MHQNGQGEYVSIGVAARLCGVTRQTIRNWQDSGRLEGVRQTRTLGENGHRRFHRQDLIREFAGDDEFQELGVEKKYMLYVRVSSNSQADHIQNQQNELVEMVKARFDCSDDDLEIIAEVNSAFHRREKLLSKVLDGVRNGNYRAVCCLYLDRLARSADSLSIIRHVCEWFNCPVVELKKSIEGDNDTWTDLMNEIQSFLVSAFNRMNSLRRKKIEIEDDVREMIIERHSAGNSIKSIYEDLKSEGILSEKGRPYSYQKIRALIKATNKGNEAINELGIKKKVMAGPKIVDYRRFSKQNLYFSSTSNEFTSLVYEAAKVYFDRNGFSIPTRHEFTKVMKEEFNLDIANGISGYRIFRGVGLKILARENVQKCPRHDARRWIGEQVKLINRSAGSHQGAPKNGGQS